MVTARPARDKDQNRSSATPPTEAQVLKFVEQGGGVAQKAVARGKPAQHPLKFPNDELFRRLEAARARGAVKLPRNTWILQAIAEKLEREDA